MGQLLATLPAGERVKRYREIAAVAFQRAASAHSETLRTEYLSLASAWQVLAIEIEHMSGLAWPNIQTPPEADHHDDDLKHHDDPDSR